MRTSRAVVGFWMVHLFTRPDELREDRRAPDRGLQRRAEVVIGGVYLLSGARRAHEDLRGRATEGKLLLDPSAAG